MKGVTTTMERIKRIVIGTLFLAVAGCATLPPGPSVTVLPPQGKPFQQFQAEDANCRKWAEQSIGMSPSEVQNQNTASGAAIGTIVGAGAGALLGSVSGHAGTGAAIGAGTGLLMGTVIGSDSGRVTGREAQRRYDIAYAQCMTSNGNQVVNQRVNTAPGYYYPRRHVIVAPAEPPPPVYYAPPPTYQPAPAYPLPSTPPPPVYAPTKTDGM